MNINIETEFVKKHIKKEYQERLIFELQSKKHREKALCRFAHSSELILKGHFLKIQTAPTFNNLSFNADFFENCYIISGGENDGITLPFGDAIEFCKTSYMVAILITSKLVIVKEECENKDTCWYMAKT